MKKLIVVALLGAAIGAIAQEVIPMIAVRKSSDLKWVAGSSHSIKIDGVEFASYTVPAGNEFRGRLNLDGVARPIPAPAQ